MSGIIVTDSDLVRNLPYSSQLEKNWHIIRNALWGLEIPKAEAIASTLQTLLYKDMDMINPSVLDAVLRRTIEGDISP